MQQFAYRMILVYFVNMKRIKIKRRENLVLQFLNIKMRLKFCFIFGDDSVCVLIIFIYCAQIDVNGQKNL